MDLVVPNEREIRRLVRSYQKAVREIGKQFAAGIDFEKVTGVSQVRQIQGLLEDLKEKTEVWGDKNIKGLFNRALKEVRSKMKEFGVARSGRIDSFSVVNDQTVQALLNDPEVGFIASTHDAVSQIQDRVRKIQTQAKMLRSQQRAFDETIATFGAIRGADVNTVRDRLVEDMVRMKHTDLEYAREIAGLPADQLVTNVANLPFVKIPDPRSQDGFRRLRVDNYAELLARTKTSQAANTARRNGALEHGLGLVLITQNRPLHDDACALYTGKLFALTQDAEREYGVPLISRLPQGGPPFHPNCTHQELPFIPELSSPREIEEASAPPPRWALDKRWHEVQKEYQRRGGFKSIRKFNRQAMHRTGGWERRNPDGTVPEDVPAEPPRDVVRDPEPRSIRKQRAKIIQKVREPVERKVVERFSKTLSTSALPAAALIATPEGKFLGVLQEVANEAVESLRGFTPKARSSAVNSILRSTGTRKSIVRRSVAQTVRGQLSEDEIRRRARKEARDVLVENPRLIRDPAELERVVSARILDPEIRRVLGDTAESGLAVSVKSVHDHLEDLIDDISDTIRSGFSSTASVSSAASNAAIGAALASSEVQSLRRLLRFFKNGLPKKVSLRNMFKKQFEEAVSQYVAGAFEGEDQTTMGQILDGLVDLRSRLIDLIREEFGEEFVKSIRGVVSDSQIASFASRISESLPGIFGGNPAFDVVARRVKALL